MHALNDNLLHLVHPAQIFFPTNMVRNKVLGRLRMRKQNAKRTVPLDVVPERRTERDVPRDFGPVIAFVSQGSDTCRQAGRERNVGP